MYGNKIIAEPNAESTVAQQISPEGNQPQGKDQDTNGNRQPGDTLKHRGSPVCGIFQQLSGAEFFQQIGGDAAALYKKGSNINGTGKAAGK